MSFENTDYRFEQLALENPYDIKLVSEFLANQGFEYNVNEVDYTMILYNLNNQIIGTGSYKRRTLKYVAVSPLFRESTAFADIVSHITNELFKTHKHTFVFTKPETAKLFEGLGYTEIGRAEPLFAVLEFGYKTIKDYQNYLTEIKRKNISENVAAIVVNCNPFTNGHKYLIETAAKENELVYLFVVEEDLSVFPFDIRWELIEKGISHLNNVVMVKAGHYIVSGGIFPNYFLKKEAFDTVSEKQAELDISIFAKYIVPVLEIKKRYVGTENYCVTTSAYNRAMHKILPEHGVKVMELARIYMGVDDDNNLNYVSASKIREAIRHGKLNEIIDFLPKTTADFLLSDDAKDIIHKIKTTNDRH